MSRYRWLIEEARRLGFNVTLDRYGFPNHDFQLLGFRYITGYYKDKHNKRQTNEKES